MLRRFASAVIVAWSILAAVPCEAGLLLSLGGSWNNFVFEPKNREDTPNYYGYGGRGGFGLSLAKVWDVALFAQYTPARMGSASATDADVTLTQYGVESGIRIFDVLYVGGRGGFWDYRMHKAKRVDEVRGSWSGIGYHGSIGLILPMTKDSLWQTTLDAGNAVVAKTNKTADDAMIGKRSLSHISVTVSFVYNSLSLGSFEDSILNSFVKNVF
jgi:hypothetical protein